MAETLAGDVGLPLEVLDWESEEGRTRALGLRIRQIPTLRWLTASACAFGWWGG